MFVLLKMVLETWFHYSEMPCHRPLKNTGLKKKYFDQKRIKSYLKVGMANYDESAIFLLKKRQFQINVRLGCLIFTVIFTLHDIDQR